MNLLRKIKNPELLIWLGVGLWWMINLIQAGFTELADDEAYYHMFAQRLDWASFSPCCNRSTCMHYGESSAPKHQPYATAHYSC